LHKKLSAEASIPMAFGI